MAETAPPETLDSQIESYQAESSSRFSPQRLRNFARATLALAGAAVILASARPDGSVADAAPAIVKDVDNAVPANPINPIATAPSVPVPETNAPDVGIATGTWDDDGLGDHTLFKDMAAEGLGEVRLSYLGNTQPLMQEMRAEVAAAVTSNIKPVLGLPVNLTPEEAASVVSQFPNVDTFVIGNEVNSPLFSTLTPPEYVDLLAADVAAIRNVRSSVEIRAFALASTYHPMAYLEAADDYANQADGGLQSMGIVLDEHDYGSLARDEQRLRTTIQLVGPNMPIVLGEVGYILTDPNHPGYNTPDEQAQNETALYAYLRQYQQVEAMDIFRFKANPADPFDTANVAQDGTFRPAYYAMQAMLLGG